MILFANQVPFRFGPDMAGESISAKPVDNIDEAAISDRTTSGRNIEFEELPIPCRRTPALATLDHDFAGNQLYDRARWVHAPILRIRNFQRPSRLPSRLSTKKCRTGVNSVMQRNVSAVT